MTVSRERLAVVLLLALFWVMAISSSIYHSNTYDEIPHIIGGYSYLRTADYRMHPENGVLPQKFAALPLWFSHPNFPALNQEAWWYADLWRFGFQFLFLSGNDPDRILLAERSMIALLGSGLGLVIFLWSRQLFGTSGAFLSLVLFLFCPTMLAHSSVVTSDISAALFLTLSVWSLWNLLHRYTLPWLLLTTFSAAGLMLSKATWMLLIVIVPLILLVRWLFGSNDAVLWRKRLAFAFVIAAGAYLLIWSFYSFRYSAFQDFQQDRDGFLFTWQQVEAHDGKPVVEFARAHHLLPEAFLFGNSLVIAATNRHNRIGFLNGEYSAIGWWYFFPYCFLVKTPLPLFLILIIAALQSKARGFYQTTPLWILLAVYWIFAMRSEVNIGQRYILPVYPATYVLAGAAASVFKAEKFRGLKIVLAACIVWFIAESLVIRPNYLAYFNELTGRPKNAYHHLVDSSLDWGQDLPGLHDWITQNRSDSQPVYFSYFGTSSPEYYDVNATRLHNADVSNGVLPDLRAGIYCVSATMLQCLYNVPFGHWSVPHESTYQQLLQKIKSGDSSPQTLDQFQRYRFARLAAFLRKRNSDAQVGYSILIYKLNAGDLQKALYGPPAELRPTIDIRGLKNGIVPPFL